MSHDAIRREADCATMCAKNVCHWPSWTRSASQSAHHKNQNAKFLPGRDSGRSGLPDAFGAFNAAIGSRYVR